MELKDVINDPKFNGLPAPEQSKVVETLLSKDEKFLALPKEEQAKVRERFNLGSSSKTTLTGDKIPEQKPITESSLDIFRKFGDKTILPLFQRYAHAVSKQSDELDKFTEKDPVSGKSAIDVERKRRLDTKGEDASDYGLMKWAHQQARERAFGSKLQMKDVEVSQQFKQIYNQAVDDPKTFGKDMIVGLVQHPELIAGKIAFPLAAMESVMEQFVEKGHVDWGQVGVETSTMAIPGVIAHSALELGLARASKVSRTPITPEVEQTLVRGMNAKIKRGEPVLAAMRDALDAVYMPPHDAVDIVNAAVEATREVTSPEIKAEASPVSAAVVRFGGKEYDGPNHFLAIQKAIKDGTVPKDENGKVKLGKGDTINLFRTRDGKIISRDEAGKLTGAKRTEEMPPLQGDEHAAQTRKVEEDNQPQHQRTDTPRQQEAEPQANSGDSTASSGEKPKEKTLSPEKQARHDELDKKMDAGELTPAEGKEFNRLLSEKNSLNKERGAANLAYLKAIGITGLGGAGYALVTENPEDAIKGALATGGVLAAGAALVRGASALGKALRDDRYRITRLTDQHSGDIRVGMLMNRRFERQVKTLVRDKTQREALTHYLQGDQSVVLTPEMQQVAIAAREFFEKQGEKGQKAGILPDDLLNDYVTQLWTGMDKNASLLHNIKQALGNRNIPHPGMAPKTRFAMERVIPSYKDGQKLGMIPTTTDIAEIMRIYGDNINRAIANKKLIQALEREKHPDVFTTQDAEGNVHSYQRSLIIPDTPDATARAIAQGAAIVDKQWQGGGDIARDIRNFAIRHAPRDYEIINHPQMRGYKVHPDIAPVMRWLFDPKDPNMATNAALAISIAAKRGLFSYSLFHAKALTESMLGQSFKGWVNVVNGDASRQLKGNLRPGESDILSELVRGGLNIDEVPLEGQIGPYTNMLKLFEEKYPILGVPAKGLQIVTRASQAFTFGVIQPTFKVAAAMAAMEKTLAKNPNMTRAQAAKAAASAVNDFFGGQDWFKIADEVNSKVGRNLALAVTSPQGRRFMQIAMLAPDWTVSTARSLIKAIPGVSRREIAALHQGYVVRSMLAYLTVANALNYNFTGHSIFQNEDWTYVDMGDGRKMQVSKHFMEMFHWLQHPGTQALNKLGYVFKEPIEQATKKEYLNEKGSPPMKNRLTHALSGFGPITGQQAYQNGSVPAISGFFGVGIYGQTDEQYAQSARERAETKKEEYTGKSDKEKRFSKPPASPDQAADRALKRRERARRRKELESEE